MTSKASDAAIERVADRWNCLKLDYGEDIYFTRECDREQALSDALTAHFGDNVPDTLAGFVLPVAVDPIVQAARRICAGMSKYENGCGGNVSRYLSGDLDHNKRMEIAIEELRAIAAQGGGK